MRSEGRLKWSSKYTHVDKTPFCQPSLSRSLLLSFPITIQAAGPTTEQKSGLPSQWAGCCIFSKIKSKREMIKTIKDFEICTTVIYIKDTHRWGDLSSVKIRKQVNILLFGPCAFLCFPCFFAPMSYTVMAHTTWRWTCHCYLQTKDWVRVEYSNCSNF